MKGLRRSIPKWSQKIRNSVIIKVDDRHHQCKNAKRQHRQLHLPTWALGTRPFHSPPGTHGSYHILTHYMERSTRHSWKLLKIGCCDGGSICNARRNCNRSKERSGKKQSVHVRHKQAYKQKTTAIDLYIEEILF